MKHYGFGSRILAWVCVVVMLVMMMPLSGFTAVEEEIVEESPVFEAPVVLAALDGEGESGDQSGGDQSGDQSGGDQTDPDSVYYTVAVAEGIANGTVVPSVGSAAEGETVSITAPPEEGYKLSEITVTDANGDPVAVTDMAFTMPAADVAISAVFVKLYTVTVSSDTNGSISAKTQAVAGESVSITVEAKAGYKLDTLSAVDAERNDVHITDNAFTMPASNVTVTATFKTKDHAINTEITGSGTIVVVSHADANESISFEVLPATGYELSGSVLVNGVPVDGNSFTMPEQATTIKAEFVQINYTIGRDIDYDYGSVTVADSAHYGDKVSFTLAGADGRSLVANSLKVTSGTDSISVIKGDDGAYSFDMPAGNVVIEAEFAYTITTENIDNGAINCQESFANPGDTVDFTVLADPADLYELVEGSVKVTYAGGEVEVAETDGVYSFKMPTGDVTITAEFKPIEFTVTLVLDSIYVSSIVREGDTTNKDIKDELGYTQSVSDQRKNRRGKLIGATYTCTFTATCEDALVVTFEKMTPEAWGTWIEWPDALYVGAVEVGGYEKAALKTTWTVEKADVTANITVTSDPVETKVEVVLAPTNMSAVDTAETNVAVEYGDSYEVLFEADAGYTLPDTIVITDVEGTVIQPVETDDAGNETVNYTWTDHLGVKKLVFNEVTETITVTAKAALNTDNYVLDKEQPTGDDNWYKKPSTGTDAVVIRAINGMTISLTGEEGTFADTITGIEDGDYTGDNALTIYTTDGVDTVSQTQILKIDTKVPVITVSGIESGDYTNSNIVLTVYVDEINFAGQAPSVSVNDKTFTDYTFEAAPAENTWTLTISADDVDHTTDGVYTITVDATDLAGNAAEQVKVENVTLDTTEPVVEVIKYSVDTYGETGNRYVNDSIDITFQVTETNFDETRFAFDGLPESGFTIGEWSSTGNVHEITVTLTADQNDGVYNDIKLAGTDMAGNDGSAPAELIVLDQEAPVVEAIKYSVDTYGETGNRYVNDSIDITFQVTETNFDETRFAFDGLPESGFTIGEWSSTGNVHEITVTLTADQNDGVYNDIKLAGTDMADNDGSAPAEPIILDQTPPTVGEITYESGMQKLPQWLLELYYHVFGKTEGEDDIVKATIEVTDATSPIDLNDAYELKIENLPSNVKIVDTTGEDSVGYSAEITFQASAQFMKQFTITAYDRAGNFDTLEAHKQDGNTNLLLDTVAPVVSEWHLTRGDTAIDYVASQVHSQNLVLHFTVEDIIQDEVFSGISKVTYYVDDEYADGDKTEGTLYVKDVSDNSSSQADYHQSLDSDGGMQIEIPASMHSNLVYVYINAVDNAGNVMVEKKIGPFRMDAVAPVVSVSYDNNSAENSTYFDATRTATISLQDISFDGTGANITTEGSIGSWSGVDTDGDGYKDDWTCTVYYGPDDDYTLSMSAWDTASPNANTTADSAVTYTGTATQEFTVDRTAPTFEITMGNADVDVSSGGYSNQNVTVTLTVDEHNFDESAATAGLSVIYEDEDISQAIRNSLVWSSNGDVRTATFTLTDDGEYKINLSFLDLAGNSTAAAEDIVVHVDQTNAEVYVTGVADKSANAQDEIIPVVTIWDKYYSLEGVVITLINGEGKDVTEQYLDMETGLSDIAYDEERDLYYQTFTFKNLDEDHVYHLEVRHTDLAGNVNTVMTVLNGKGEEEVLDLEESVMRFSVNRNGSTYSASEETLAILGQYVQSAKNVRILEINVDELDPESIYITLTHDNVTRDLVYGEDYTYQTPPEQNDASWNVYEYVLEDSLFEEDGVYTITIYSVDAAGNVAQNNTAEKDFEITFVVDKTSPIFVALNLEAGEIYNEEQHEVTINCSDNIALDTVYVYRLDSTAEKDEDGYYIWFDNNGNALGEEVALTAVEGSNGDYTFVIYEGDSAATSKQSVLVVCTDKAGNQNMEQEILDFTVSSSFWIRFYANKPLFYGSIGGISALLIVAAVVFLRKKKEDEET